MLLEITAIFYNKAWDMKKKGQLNKNSISLLSTQYVFWKSLAFNNNFPGKEDVCYFNLFPKFSLSVWFWSPSLFFQFFPPSSHDSEIIRVLDSLQLTATKKVATPADWKVSKLKETVKFVFFCIWLLILIYISFLSIVIVMSKFPKYQESYKT